MRHLTCQTNPDRAWMLTAGTASEASTWAGLLLEAKNKYTPDQDAAAADGGQGGSDVMSSSLHAVAQHDEPNIPNDEDEENLWEGRGVWMVKKGEGIGRDRRRFFTLVMGKESGAIKLNYYGSVKDDRPVDKKGFIVIGPSSGFMHDSNSVVIVSLGWLESPLIFSLGGFFWC